MGTVAKAPPLSRRIVAIVNPMAGRRDMLSRVEEVGKHVERGGGSFTILHTQRAGHAADFVSQVGDDVDAFLVVGGDGTVNEVVNGLGESRTPFVVCSAGTENILARELQMPKTPRGIAGTLLEGEPVDYDLGAMNGRRFHTVSGVGFDAECVRRAGAARSGHITRLDYLGPTWRAFRGYTFPSIRVEIDGNAAFEGRGFILVGVNRKYAGWIRILKHALWDDGLLDVCIFPCASWVDLIAHGWRMMLGCHVGRGGALYRQARRIRVRSDERVPIHLDGEVAGELPADYESCAGAVRFLRLGAPSRA